MLLLSFCAPACRGLLKEVFQAPKVRIQEVTLASSPLLDPGVPWEFRLTLAVENPNSYPLNVSYVAYTAILGRETLADGELRTDIRIRESGITEVAVPIAVKPDAFLSAGRRLLQMGRIEYEFNGSLLLDAGIVGNVRIPFSRTGTFDPVDLLRKKRFGIN